MSDKIDLLKIRIKEERLKLDLKQEELGAKLGVAKQTIGKYEQGIVKPTVDNLEKLADIFNCSTDYLLGRTDDRDSIIYSGVVDGKVYKLEIDKVETDLPNTEEKFLKLIKKLESIGFNVDKLLEDDAEFNLNKN